MQQHWFCSRCGSMNRADADNCYKCRGRRATSTVRTTVVPRAKNVSVPSLGEDNLKIARAFMSSGRYTSSWQLGYLAGVTMMVAVILEVYLAVGLLVAVFLKGGFSFDALRGVAGLAGLLGAGAAGLSLVALIMLGVFLGLTSMNAPALGCGIPGYGPLRSALWPIETVLWVVWGVTSSRSMDQWFFKMAALPSGPDAATDNPPLLLWYMMGIHAVPSRSESRLIHIWAAEWGLVVCLFYVGIIALVLALCGIDPPLVVLLVIGSLIVPPMFLTLALIAIEIARRQRIREQWVLGELRAEATGTAAIGPSESPAPAPELRPEHTPQPSQPLQAEPAPTAGPGPQVAPPVLQTPTASRPSSVPVPTYRVGLTGEDPVVWSRPVERVARRDPDAVPHEELPVIWRQAIERSAPTRASQSGAGGDAAAGGEGADRAVIQPSAASISRYRVPQRGAPDRKPVEEPSDSESSEGS